MYNTIKNPLTGRKVNIKSSLGKKILKAFLSESNVQNGGISFKNRKGDFLHHIGTDEGDNAITACSACTMMALGLPDEIVNDVSIIHQANLIINVAKKLIIGTFEKYSIIPSSPCQNPLYGGLSFCCASIRYGFPL